MTQLFVTIIFILSPGILATVISDKIAYHSKWDSFKFGLYSFLFGVLSYGLVQGTLTISDWVRSRFGSMNELRELAIWNSVLHNGQGIKLHEVICASTAAIPLAFFVSWAVNYKLFNKIAGKCKVTTKYGDENLYTYYLNSDEISWVYVRDIANGLTYQGQVIAYSENDHLQELVLDNVSVYRYEDSYHLYDVAQIYLGKPCGQLIIEAIPREMMEKADG